MLLKVDDAEVVTLPPPRKPIFSPEESSEENPRSKIGGRNDSQNRKNARERLQALKQSKLFPSLTMHSIQLAEVRRYVSSKGHKEFRLN
jgi:hypothetical protein